MPHRATAAASKPKCGGPSNVDVLERFEEHPGRPEVESHYRDRIAATKSDYRRRRLWRMKQRNAAICSTVIELELDAARFPRVLAVFPSPAP
jgi:hypothetical protein